MESDRRALLNQILEYHFACIELNLYLDNNPGDEDALCEYNMYFEEDNTLCFPIPAKEIEINSLAEQNPY